jgi:DNA-binding transcriptional regulator LsrR (DeoR family)
VSPRGKRQSRHRKRSAGELDELAIAVASLHHEQGIEHKAVAAELQKEGKDVRDERDVRALLARARERSLVSINVVPRAAPPRIDVEVSEALAAATGARRALAVVTDLASDERRRSDNDGKRARRLRESNELHSILGAAAASYIWGNLREGDRVAVGGGRGSAHTIAALGRIVPASYAADHGVLSLSGTRMSSRRASGVDIPGAEADYSASNLAALLIKGNLDGNNVKLCRLPGFIGDRHRDSMVNRFASHLRRVPSKPLDADVAVFGGGVIDDAHELMLVPDPQNDEIKDELAKIRGLVEDDCPAPVVNFCDVFYAGPDIPARRRKQIARVVDGLNRKVVTVTPEKLQPVHEKILVAGGRQKLPALRLLARDDWEGIKPTTLVTDNATARHLLA